MPKVPKSRKNCALFFPDYELRRREYGFKPDISWENNFKYSLYSTLSPTNEDRKIFKENPSHGGIFNFAFSPDGRQLAAACENKCILFYDPVTQKQFHSIQKAHNGCVNCVRFLDSRLFATCSDDTTVALWDVRKLNRRIRLLNGHQNWVKSIEYSASDGLLVSSGFDGRILGWDINSFRNDGSNYTELFNMKGLMRVRLTPDASKLVICTTSGHMVLIHNLDLLNLLSDWKDFQTKINESNSTKRFRLPNSARNRFEFISDFPNGNEAEVIHSLQVHPQGWCVLSRNTSAENTSEWTCVHDIQDIDDERGELDDDGASKVGKSDSDNESHISPGNSSPAQSSSVPRREMRRRGGVSFSRIEIPRVEIMLRHMAEDRQPSDSEDSDDASDQPGSRNLPRETLPDGPGRDFEGFEGTDGSLQLRVTSLGILEALERIGVLQQEQWRHWRHISSNNNTSSEQSTSSNSQGAVPASDFSIRCRRDPNQPRSSPNLRSAFFVQERPPRLSPLRPIVFEITRTQGIGNFFDDKVFSQMKRTPRLTNYIEELNKGRGFIKELCFSSDGRLICSPYGRGVRLLMFDNKCSELSHCIDQNPQPLYPVSKPMSHSQYVVSTQFSPTDCLLVSGCLSGEIVWHQPNL